MGQEKYDGYVGSPYNFVGISEKVYQKQELQPHNLLDQKKKSGKIVYEIKALTPVYIGGSEDRFYRNCYGKTAIPGSSVRGLVRSNVQILSCSSVRDDIQNGRLMYRNVAAGKEKKNYNEILGNKQLSLSRPNGRKYSLSVLNNVKAGYIRKNGNRYEIVQTAVDGFGGEFRNSKMNYYVLSERVIKEDTSGSFDSLKKQVELQNIGFREGTIKRGGEIKSVQKGIANKKYRPYYRQVFYQLKGIRQITAVKIVPKSENGHGAAAELPKGAGWHKGWILSTGPMQNKKVVYIIPEIDESKDRILIPQEDIDDYKRDYEGKRKQIETIDKTFFQLPKDGETRPVFYIEHHAGDRKRLYFGYTPHLRLFYKNDIFSGLSTEQKTARLDYARSLFGFSDEDAGYKSRLSFTDAVMQQQNGKFREEKVILSEPKPTSYLDYLEADPKDGVASYNDSFRLRGVKQYWLKKSTVPAKIGKNDKVTSSLFPCGEGTVFRGEIRFTNLTEEELGMVLWGLRLEPESNQNIGKGKPYGYGRVEVSVKSLQVQNLERLYGDQEFCLQPYDEETGRIGDYVAAAKAEMSAFLGHDVMKDAKIRDFLLMKDSRRIPPAERTRYMGLDQREYQSRVDSLVKLPTPQDVIENRAATCGKKKFDQKKTGGPQQKNYNGRGKNG